ncbi:hypothetical protein [Vibrio hibernica]|uniref:hypothetical protein n=1 Tax=Vibrio hibernica TaxID=2587465 RepID=UPI0039B12138
MFLNRIFSRLYFNWLRVSLVGLLTLMVMGCSSGSSNTSEYSYTNGWWYDDYWFYQDHVYPNCCHTDGELKDAVNSWWHTLDPDKQAEIKEKIEGWKEGDGGPDISAFKQDLNKKYQSLPAYKQQALSTKRDQVREQMSGKTLTTDQKQAVRTQWQSKDRPTLKRSNISRPIHTPARPVTRPVGGLGGGGRLGGDLHR